MEQKAKRLAVFSIRRGKVGKVWTRAGTAWVNADNSLNVYLDVLPLDGQLHLREAGDSPASARSDEADAAASMGGH